MRAHLYETVGFAFWGGSAYLFVRALAHLGDHDYVAGLAVLVAGLLVVRTGLELTKLSVAVRRES